MRVVAVVLVSMVVVLEVVAVVFELSHHPPTASRRPTASLASHRRHRLHPPLATSYQSTANQPTTTRYRPTPTATSQPQPQPH